jgi:hypothetical protein
MSEKFDKSDLTGKTILLFFDQDKAFLADQTLYFSDLDFPAAITTFESQAVWQILVNKHDKQQNCLYASVISYNEAAHKTASNPADLRDQLNKIRQIRFRKLDTRSLLRSAAGNRTPRKLVALAETQYAARQEETKKLQQVKIIQERFSVPIKSLRFQLGAVSFDRNFWFTDQTIHLSIKNYELREEFDAVKNYFINALKTHDINVVADFELQDDEVKILKVESPEIARIDKALIETVRFEFVSGIGRKKSMLDIDQSLFTMEELLAHYADEGFNSNAFYQSDLDFFDDLLQITDTRHYRHLRFLSSIHAHHIMKLRFVLNPFSFVFLVEGSKYYHLIWETLDTEEATYIWSCDKRLDELKLATRKLDDILSVIKAQGKTAYLNTVEDPFRRVYHDYSDLQDGFVKWKALLEQYLA